MGGLADVVKQLKEMVILPLLYPELFRSLHTRPPGWAHFPSAEPLYGQSSSTGHPQSPRSHARSVAEAVFGCVAREALMPT